MEAVKVFSWRGWKPQERATLLFVRKGGRILLIEKKRGLGKGKVNAPGGRLEAGETPLQAAIRETQEEVLVTPTDVEEKGTIDFAFTNGYTLRCYVFVASGFTGRLGETPEAHPFWVSERKIPYERMWADDRIWLPLLLAGHAFKGRFYFKDDLILQCRLGIVSPRA